MILVSYKIILLNLKILDILDLILTSGLCIDIKKKLADSRWSKCANV